jgi:lipoate-protein ligase B
VSDALLVRTPVMAYEEAWDVQRRLAALLREGRLPDVVWLLEHPPTYTYGRHGARADLYLDDDALARLGASVHRIDRGGQMTWHGPGQTTGYVIADVRRHGGVRRFVCALVSAMAEASGIPGAAAAEPTGAYVEGRKLGSVGIRVSGGVSTHGLALNRDPDLGWFARMSACGAPDIPATTIAAEGGDPDRERVEAALALALAERLSLRLEAVPLEAALAGAAVAAAT